jgi:hypothetical protein
MERAGVICNSKWLVYDCPTCLKRHYHGYSPTEPEPFRRVTHCPLEDTSVLIYLKKKPE